MNYLEKKKKAMLNYVSGITPPLPSEYQQVEWIGATGTQRINTPLIVDVDVSIKINFAISEEMTSDCFVCGGRYGGNERQLTVRWRTSNKIWVITPKNNSPAGSSISREIPINIPKETFMQVDVMCTDTSNEIYINNNLEFSNTDTKTAFNNGTRISLFCCMLNNSNSELPAKAKISHCELYKGNTLEHNFIPCYHKSDDVIGMYDLVTNTFFTNQGSGTFTKGNDV